MEISWPTDGDRNQLVRGEQPPESVGSQPEEEFWLCHCQVYPNLKVYVMGSVHKIITVCEDAGAGSCVTSSGLKHLVLVGLACSWT
jgi:hypothetical protein